MAYFCKLTNDNAVLEQGKWILKWSLSLLDKHDSNWCMDKGKGAKFSAYIFEPISLWKALKHPRYIENSLLI